MIDRIIIRTSLVKNRCTYFSLFYFSLLTYFTYLLSFTFITRSLNTPGRSENLTIEGYQITRHRHF